MMENEHTKDSPLKLDDPKASRSFGLPIGAVVFCWLALSAGFLGLKLLMEERPQFIGQPGRGSTGRLVQRSPQIVTRKLSDSVSAIKAGQPASANIRFEMAGFRDYRGLKTVIDMSGEFQAEYRLTNDFAEPVFVLFRCPHPQAESGANLSAAGLKLVASVPGLQENAKDAWLWTGTIEPHRAATIAISYRAASLIGVKYLIEGGNGGLVNEHKIAFNRRELPSIRFESGDGIIRSSGEGGVWERKDFLAPDYFAAEIVEGRSLYISLSQLMEIGPLISLMFLLSVAAILLAKQRVTAVQLLTIGACYGLYFPLILYLSARFSFGVAMVIAVVVPGALLLNYARWLFGPAVGLVGGVFFIALYEIFPTLAAFAGWNRGMVLLCLGVVTLWVLINLQNQALSRSAAKAMLAVIWIFMPVSASSAEIQVLLPAELAASLVSQKQERVSSLVGFGVGSYQMRHEATYFQVDAEIPFHAIRAGEAPVPIFGSAVHLQESHLQSESNVAQLVTITNGAALFVQGPGSGTLRLRYRAPIERHEGKIGARIPVLPGAAGNIRLESDRADLEMLTGAVWGKNTSDKRTIYELGAAGEDSLLIEWREDPSSLPAKPAETSREFYGIGLTRSQNLTIIHSDGTCTHFVEFELPASQQDEFRMRLPADSRLISVTINGADVALPTVEDQLCRIRLPEREPQQRSRVLSFRLNYPRVSLGFIGSFELALPQVFQTAGTLEWIVALPYGFDTQVLSSGLDLQKTPPDLSRFGDYGRVLKLHPQTYLAKNLVPPGSISLILKYRQMVAGIIEPLKE